MSSYDDANAVCQFIKSRVSYTPLVCIVCGSGLGNLGDSVENQIIIKYSDIEQFPKSTGKLDSIFYFLVVGHAGNLIFGDLGGKKVVIMQGRFHPYEGYAMSHVTLPIRVMKLLGCQYVFLTNAAGGLHPNYAVGDIILLRDHISLPALSGINPLVGENDDRFGPRFPALAKVYDPELRSKANAIAKAMNLQKIVHEGVYIACMGPAYETPAESRMLRILGGDVAGNCLFLLKGLNLF